MITHLDPVVAVREPETFAGADHPMRVITRDVAFGITPWDAERAQRVAELFDGLAGGWSEERSGPERLVPIADALDRGNAAPGRCVELGSGTGLATQALADRFASVVAVDLSGEMLRNAVTDAAPRVRADASRMPLDAGVVDTLLLMNMLLFPAEVDRILAPGGTVVWINSRGSQTPIHLPAEQVAAALPGSWAGVASRAGTATWAVLRRS